MNEHERSSEPDDRDLAALLGAVGPRARPAADSAAQVRAAVESEWRATVAARQQRRRLTAWAAAAGIAVAAVAVWMARPLYGPGPEAVASLARVVGDVQRNTGNGRWTPLATGAAIEPGTRIRTGTDGRVALTLSNGTGLRLDARTLLALDDLDHATLATGAVYVDSGAGHGAPAPDFELETPSGSIRHLGTQYEARVLRDGLSVAVREGRVAIGVPAGQLVGNAGERVTLTGARVERSPLAATASDWDWIEAVTPPFTIEGRTVDAFLAWAARETGRSVAYASPEAELQAGSVTLRGTIAELTPDEAVAAVLATTSLRPVIDQDRIRIEAAAR